MKIGIMTFWQTDNNYGQIMQCFALQTALKKLQHEPFLMRYFLIRKYKNFWMRQIKHLFEFSRYRFFLYRIFQKEPDRHFEDFRKEHLNVSHEVYRSLEECRNSGQADAYIVGSDQVWNYSLFGDDPEPAFFLQFTRPECRRIAYAPSFGMEKIPSAFEETVRTWLKTFTAVSVRDEASQNICLNQLGMPASLVVDPTLLLDAGEYEALFDGEIPSEPYCVFYHLAGWKNSNIRKIKKFCKANGLKLVYIPVNRNGSADAVYPTIGNWLKYLANARFVITNSFHGTIFSMLFRRKFITLTETNALAKRNVRITSLLSKFHSSERIVDLDTVDLEKYYQADAFAFNEKDHSFIQQSRDFLRTNLQ